MPKYTIAERQYIKSIVANLSLKRIIDNDIIFIIKENYR